MKKTIAIMLLVCTLLSCLASCGGGKKVDEPQQDAGNDNGSSSGEGSEQTPPEEGSDGSSSEGNEPAGFDEMQPVTLNIGSYNIANGREVDHNMMKLAKDISGKKLDIVGLQEVDQFCNRSGNIDTVKTLAELTGMKYYCFYKAINLSGNGPDGKGEYGSAILSKYPILETESRALNTEGKEGRVLGRAAIDVNGTTIQFFVTHLSYESGGLRARQFLEVNAVISSYENVILTGDFNISSLAEYKVLENMSTVNTEEHFVYTFPSKRTCIDNIVYSQDAFTFGEPNMLANGNSDHNMLYATCVMRPSSLVSDAATITGADGVDVSKLTDGLLANAVEIGAWKEGTAGAYVEIDLQADYNLSALRVVNGVSPSRVCKWVAYGSADNTLAIDAWTKLGEKSGDEVCTAEGYSVTLGEEAKALKLRYIRIYGTYCSEGEQYPVSEVFVFGKIANAKKADLSAKAEITDAAGNKLTVLSDRLVTESVALGNCAEGTAGGYLAIDFGEPTILYALNLTTPLGKNYKWAAYASLDKDAPMSDWTLIAEKNDFSVTTDAGYTVYLAGKLKETPYRYIRVYGTGCDGGEKFEANEVYLYGMKVSDLDNLMIGATADPLYSDGDTKEYDDLGYWAEKVTGPAYGTAGTCYAEIDLNRLCHIETLRVVNYVASSRVYQWEAYVTDDATLPIEKWIKIGGKSDNSKSTAAGYTLTLSEALQELSVRYVRIYGTYHNGNCGYHISEVEIRGREA